MEVAPRDPRRSRRIPSWCKHLEATFHLWDGEQRCRTLDSGRLGADSARGRPELGSTGSAVGGISARLLVEEEEQGSGGASR